MFIGGLIGEEVRDVKRRVPILGSIPVLGALFRSQDSERVRTERIVLARPFVISTPADVEALSRDILSRLSIHPSAGDSERVLDAYSKDDALTPEEVRDTLLKNLNPVFSAQRK